MPHSILPRSSPQPRSDAPADSAIPTDEILRQTRQAFQIGQKGLADFFHVTQSTISRWENRKLFPSLAHQRALRQISCAIWPWIHRFSHLPGQLHYVCSFADKYPSTLCNDAYTALELTGLKTLMAPSPQSDGAMSLDLFMRGARLGSGIRAHCFVDDLKRPRAVIVLVNSQLSLFEQHAVACDEVYAHVMHRFGEASKQSPQPYFAF